MAVEVKVVLSPFCHCDSHMLQSGIQGGFGAESGEWAGKDAEFACPELGVE